MNDVPPLQIHASPQFARWMLESRLSLALTTYQAGKVFWLGVDPQGRLSVFERTLERVMGMSIVGQDMYLSTLYQLWRFRNALPAGQLYQGYDRVYMPRESFVTGDIDIHDIAVDEQDRVLFVSTLFNCIAETSSSHNFRPVWRPPWISAMVPEDRCHLNGMALRDGRLRYVTSVSQSDVSDAWRDFRGSSGVVYDVENQSLVCDGLSMPHSPRWHRGRLYLLNSGQGTFGYVDRKRGSYEPIAFVPGYARGLTLVGDWAVIGLSDRRENRTFQGLALEDALSERGEESRAGVSVVDIRSGETAHWLRFEGIVKELYDVACVPGARRPMGVGFKSDEVRRMISHAPAER